MLDLLERRRADRQAAVVHFICCVLATFPNEDLDLIEMGPKLRSAVMTMRRQDDYVGSAAAYFAMAVANHDTTTVDKTVAGQIMGVAASCILQGKVPTKEVLDGEDVLTNTSVFADIMNWVSASGPPSGSLQGDAWLEASYGLLGYIEQYNRNLENKTYSPIKFGTDNDDERGQDEITPRSMIDNMQ